MLVLDADQIRARTQIAQLITCLERAFRAGFSVPSRTVVHMPGGTGDRLMLNMPAFDRNGSGIVKLVTVVPDNRLKGRPTIQAVIVVFSEAGTPIALLDGTIVTQLRTGAASALASKFLSRTDSAHLVIVGTGALAPMMAAAHSAVRPITRISVYGRHTERAAATAESIRTLIGSDPEVVVSDSLEQAVATADIISCCTSSDTPILAGKWLRPGTFVDLVGSFSPRKRESDDDVVLRSRIFVDTLEGALAEAGDILDPLRRGIIARDRIEAELADLVSVPARGRRNDTEITLFKSVGTALEDLAATQIIVSTLSEGAS